MFQQWHYRWFTFFSLIFFPAVTTISLPFPHYFGSLCLYEKLHSSYGFHFNTRDKMDRNMVIFSCLCHLCHRLRDGKSSPHFSWLQIKPISLVLRCHGYKLFSFNRSIKAFGLDKVLCNSSQHYIVRQKKGGALFFYRNHLKSFGRTIKLISIKCDSYSQSLAGYFRTC